MSETWTHRQARMKTGQPKAEQLIDIELQRRGLLRLFEPKNTVILFDRRHGLRVVRHEAMTHDMAEQARKEGFYCVPDRTYSPAKMAFFFDGPPHRRDGVKRRDEKIDDWLRTWGWRSVRFPYSSPSIKLVNEVVDEIQELTK